MRRLLTSLWGCISAWEPALQCGEAVHSLESTGSADIVRRAARHRGIRSRPSAAIAWYHIRRRIRSATVMDPLVVPTATPRYRPALPPQEEYFQSCRAASRAINRASKKRSPRVRHIRRKRIRKDIRLGAEAFDRVRDFFPIVRPRVAMAASERAWGPARTRLYSLVSMVSGGRNILRRRYRKFSPVALLVECGFMYPVRNPGDIDHDFVLVRVHLERVPDAPRDMEAAFEFELMEDGFHIVDGVLQTYTERPMEYM